MVSTKNYVIEVQWKGKKYLGIKRNNRKEEVYAEKECGEWQGTCKYNKDMWGQWSRIESNKRNCTKLQEIRKERSKQKNERGEREKQRIERYQASRCRVVCV